MKNSSSLKINRQAVEKKLKTGCLLSAMIITLSMPAAAFAQNTGNQGYWVSSNGQVVKDSSGHCWRAGYWTPAMATEECDPDLIKKAEASVSPPVQAAAAAPVSLPERKVLEKITFSADALFDFDNATLKSGGKALLDKLADELKSIKQPYILAIGHTDRIGSDRYNLKLSLKRANAVQDYLVSKGIAADAIKTEGRGKAEPVTKAGDCKGPKSKKIIACLQPDRRVDIEISGAKERTVDASPQ